MGPYENICEKNSFLSRLGNQMHARPVPQSQFETSSLLARMILEAWRSANSGHLQWTLDIVLENGREQESTYQTGSTEEAERMELVESLADRMRLELNKRPEMLSMSRFRVWAELLDHLSNNEAGGAAPMAVN